jgi:hypothetical protein
MGGWRDVDGRTARERRRVDGEANVARLAEAVRRRPLTLLKGFAGFAFALMLALALIAALR